MFNLTKTLEGRTSGGTTGNILVLNADQISSCGGFYDEITQNMLLLDNNPPHRKIYLSHWEKRVVFHVIHKPWLLPGVAGFPKVVFSVFYIAISEA